MTTAARASETPIPISRPESALRCFIAANARSDLGPIRRLLRERRVDAVLAHEAALPGMTVAGKVTSLITESDLMVAILDQGKSTANITFEIGYAFALNKKILIIAPPGADLPADLTALFFIRATPDNADAIGFALDQLLAAPTKQGRSPAGLGAAGRPIGGLADVLLSRLKVALAADKTSELEQIVLDAIRAGSPTVVVDVPEKAFGRPDVAVWSDDLEPWVGNPLLIEVRARLGGNAAQLTRRQLESYIEISDSRWMLVLYADGPPQDKALSLSSPPVLFMRLDHFLESLRIHSLADTLRPLRNAAIHRPTIPHGE